MEAGYYEIEKSKLTMYSYICDAIDNDNYVYLLNIITREPKRFHKTKFNKLYTSKKEAYLKLIEHLNDKIGRCEVILKSI